MINDFLKKPTRIPPLDISFPVDETCRKAYFSGSSELYWTHLPCLKRDKVLEARGRVGLARAEQPRCAGWRKSAPAPSPGGDRLGLDWKLPRVLQGATEPLGTALPTQQVPQRNDCLEINRFQLFIWLWIFFFLIVVLPFHS